jgi:nitrile hydratase
MTDVKQNAARTGGQHGLTHLAISVTGRIRERTKTMGQDVTFAQAVHHVVCCTLCSCYPRNILGIPPAWYKSREYRSRVVIEPRAVLKEFGTELPAQREIRVVDSTADMRYLVIPLRPQGTDGWDEARLATLVTRDSMIGVSQVLAP